MLRDLGHQVAHVVRHDHSIFIIRNEDQKASGITLYDVLFIRQSNFDTFAFDVVWAGDILDFDSYLIPVDGELLNLYIGSF